MDYLQLHKNGIKAKESGQLKSVCSNGGKVGGSKNRDNKYGLFSLTKEQKSEYGKLGAIKSYPKMLNWCKETNHWETVADVHRGVPKSKEQKEKISKKLKGRKLPNDTRFKMSQSRMGHVWSDTALKNLKKAAQKRCISVSKFTLDGIWIEDFIGLSEAGDSIGHKNGRAIQLVCNYYRDNLTKGSKQSGGFIWKYKK
jgi:hypothetical protein